MLPEVVATRYVVPLREGGSLPGLMEADDLGTFVVKFRGAGQGPRVLVADRLVHLRVHLGEGRAKGRREPLSGRRRVARKFLFKYRHASCFLHKNRVGIGSLL